MRTNGRWHVVISQANSLVVICLALHMQGKILKWVARIDRFQMKVLVRVLGSPHCTHIHELEISHCKEKEKRKKRSKLRSGPVSFKGATMHTYIPMRQAIHEGRQHLQPATAFGHKASVHFHSHGVHNLSQPRQRRGTRLLKLLQHIACVTPLRSHTHAWRHHHSCRRTCCRCTHNGYSRHHHHRLPHPPLTPQTNKQTLPQSPLSFSATSTSFSLSLSSSVSLLSPSSEFPHPHPAHSPLLAPPDPRPSFFSLPTDISNPDDDLTGVGVGIKAKTTHDSSTNNHHGSNTQELHTGATSRQFAMAPSSRIIVIATYPMRAEEQGHGHTERHAQRQQQRQQQQQQQRHRDREEASSVETSLGGANTSQAILYDSTHRGT